MNTPNYSYPLYAKLLHMGMAAFGVTAYLTAEFAEDGGDSIGYLLHAYLGLSLTVVLLLRLAPGFMGSGPLQLRDWHPFLRKQWVLAAEDVRGLMLLRVPQRGRHEGLAGLTQGFGLLLFCWMAATGTGLFILGDGPESVVFELLEEIHEVGESLIPLYLALHVGSVLVHSMTGTPIWRRMWISRPEQGKD
jgi:cytochrome b